MIVHVQLMGPLLIVLVSSETVDTCWSENFVLYIDNNYSNYSNRNGLFFVTSYVAETGRWCPVHL